MEESSLSLQDLENAAEDTQPVHTTPPKPNPARPAAAKPAASPKPNPAPPKKIPLKRRKRRGCTGGGAILLAALIGFVLYLLFPTRTNVLVFGIDSRPEEGNAARADTIMLASVVPLTPDVNLLSIPRDLWVTMPDGSENRINAAHVFAELNETGSGPAAMEATVRDNFGVQVDYFVRLRFEGVTDVVDTLGGVTVTLPRAMSGYEAGSVTLDGTAALAFVRDRTGSDDFFRMERGQIFLRGLMRTLLEPSSWGRLPALVPVVVQLVETDIPVWAWPRLGLAVLRAGPNGIVSKSITREMVNPFTTGAGAQVLAPNWDIIRPELDGFVR